jgi:capsular exopolysaccharide synthesis family protein
LELESPPVEGVDTKREENQFHFLLTVLENRWRLIVLLTLIGAGGAVAFQYYARGAPSPPGVVATIELSHKRLPLSFRAAKEEAPRSVAILPLEEFREAINLEQVAGSLRASNDLPEGWDEERLLSAMRLEVSGGNPETLLVSVHGADSALVLELAEQLGGLVSEAHDVLLRQRIEDEKAYLQEELAILSANLESATARELDYLEHHEFSSYEEVAEHLRSKTRELEAIHERRQTLLAASADVEARIASAQESLPDAFSRLSDTVITNLIAELQDLIKEELSLAMIYQPAYPPLQEIRAEIIDKENTVYEALRRYEETDGAGIRAWNGLKALRDRNAEILAELADLEAQEESTAARVEELSEELPKAAKSTQEYTRISFDVNEFREEYRETLALEFDLRRAMRAGVGHLEQRAPASVAAVPSQESGLLGDVMLGAFVGLVAAISLSLLVESADTSIHSEREAQAHFNRPIVGTVPNMDQVRSKKMRHGRRRKKGEAPGPGFDKVDPSIVTLHDPQSPFSEAYRAIRTNLFFATFNDPFKVIMVTSAVPAEGKTTTSVNLATVMAQNGSRVLLIDADLRRPHVHSVLGVERSPGLADVLSKQAEVHDIIQTSPVPGLMVIPSGHLPSNPSELIGSSTMRDLLQQLGEEFDVVVCDVPSVVVVTDALLIARHVDYVLMVVSVNNARRQTIERALTFLDTAKCKIAGLVLNGLQPSRRRHYYYYYYYDDQAQKKRKRWFNAE